MLGPKFADALAYATELHAAQTRKRNGGTAYIGHLLSVAGLVIEEGGTETQAIAALLHDAAEDQGGEARLAEIAERFGDDVALIVRECSDTLEQDKPPWRPRKEAYIAHLADAHEDTLLVSLADKVDNARAMLRDYRTVGEELWARFNESDPQQQLWYYRGLVEAFAQRFDGPLLEELRITVDDLAAAREQALQ
ncbi:MAG: HD domain-containing protein [Pyrinomonadaceae bacterium]